MTTAPLTTLLAPILAIDCTTGPSSAALWQNGKVIGYAQNLAPTQQSATLIPMIEQLLHENKLNYQNLSAIVTSVGPGSFTGIRIGLAAAKGLAYAAGIPVLGFTTLDILHHAIKDNPTPRLAILNAGKGEVYYQYDGGTAQLGPMKQLLAEAPADPVTVAGNITIEKDGFIHSPITFPRADALAGLAASGYPPLPATPFYIRPPDAKLPTTPINPR